MEMLINRNTLIQTEWEFIGNKINSNV